jgi:LCP family protein required for cell wall assembly
LLALVILLAGWLSWQAYHIYVGIEAMTSKTAPRTPREHKHHQLPHPLSDSTRINFLVLGSDNDRKKEEARPLTQSMIVVTVDPVHHKVGMLSIPRDFWVPIQGHGHAKIDLANKYGGISLARQTVEDQLGITIDYYAWVGLNGFRKVIDTFGGVDLDAIHPIFDDRYPQDLTGRNPYSYRRIFIPAGWQHMDGTQALEYVRSRHGDAIGDFSRSSRQQQVLLQLKRKADAVNVLMHLSQLVDDLQNTVQTDLTPPELFQLSQWARQIRSQDIYRVVLQAPTYSSYAFRDGQSVVLPNWRKIRPVVRQMFAPIQTAPSPVARAAPPTPRPTAGRPSPRPTPRPARARPGKSAPNPRPSPALKSLPGALVFERDGNLYELTPQRSLVQLTWSKDGSMPAMAPDGKTLAFVRFTYGLQKYGKYASDIWLMDTKTRRQYVITHDENQVVENNLWAAWPSWSPDGKKLAFSWDAAKLAQPPSDGRPVDLNVWSVGTDGKQATQLTPGHQQLGGGGDTDPAWRPHRQQILYVAWSYLPTGQPYSQLMLLDVPTGRRWALTPPGGRVLQPSWDASGNTVTYISGSGSADGVVVAALRTSGGVPRLEGQRTIATGEVAQPSFAPGGRWISYLGLRGGGGFSLFMAPKAGGSPVQLTESGSLDARSRPAWTR